MHVASRLQGAGYNPNAATGTRTTNEWSDTGVIMSREDWNKRWSGAGETDPNQHHGHEQPDALLVQVAGVLEPGRSVDIGCGLGSNVIWLADQGWDATGVDISDVAIDGARARAARRGVQASFVVSDAASHAPDQTFDLVSMFYLQLPDDQRHEALKAAVAALAPGGHLLFVGHDVSDIDTFTAHIHSHDHHHDNHGGGGEPNADLERLASRLTSPGVVAGELEQLGLSIIRAEVVQHAAHGDGQHMGTTLVLATRA